MMKAAVLQAPREFRIETVPLPEPATNQVRVRLQGCGVCASNLPVWQGRPWFDYPLAPGAPGHEGWGHIDAVGAEVQGLAVGDRVALLSSHAYAQWDLARAGEVLPLPPALDGRPFPGEALGCAMNIFNRSDVRENAWVAIVGIGFLGALLTFLAVRAKARVIAVSRRASALETARRFGAVHTLLYEQRREVVEAVRDITGGALCERVIEATGYQEPLDLAGELTAERARLVIAGYHQDSPRQIDLQLWNWRGLDVVNAHERDPRQYIRGMAQAAAEVAGDRLHPFGLFTHTFGLNQINAAFQALQRRDSGFLKALIIP
jgi:threonine dehydrogenase-like Zn-dependent dehydrogenase